MKQTTAIIGSGIGGIASAIRLAVKGYKVTVFEQAASPGGKISQLKQDGFRFDTGPSLFTLPELVDELFRLCNEDPGKHFRYHPTKTSCKYFWEDGTCIHAWQKPEEFAREVENVTGVSAYRTLGFLERSRRLYELTSEVFIFNSFHKVRNFLTRSFLRPLFQLHRLDAMTSMHKRNKQWFGHPKVVQLFDRYATYNGSNPYQTPATLNVIAHLEHNTGAWFPEQGMYAIVEALVALARRQGVDFRFNARVTGIILENNKAAGIRVGDEFLPFDVVVSDIDIVNLYRRLMPGVALPGRQIKGERSTSALIFYWGVDREFPELELHNILFSDNYEEEFRHLFQTKTICDDPTVYLFISSKQVKGDAPPGSENWYVMINVPENIGQNWDEMVDEVRKHIVGKINRILKTDIEKHIVAETIADPRSIERDTGSYRGSLYGLSSNGRFSAFNRHPNFKRRLKNLYFAGGSVHPGGGIPLCLASAKIVGEEVPVPVSRQADA
jgi:diapolycopene oxygenase